MFVRADRHVPVPLPHALLRRGELQAVAHCDHVEIRDGVASVDPDDATWLPCAAKPELAVVRLAPSAQPPFTLPAQLVHRGWGEMLPPRPVARDRPGHRLSSRWLRGSLGGQGRRNGWTLSRPPRVRRPPPP